MVLGGQCDAASLSTQIAKYKIDQWSYVGNLLRTRSSHRAILVGQQIHVVGGYNLREFQSVKLCDLILQSSLICQKISNLTKKNSQNL